MSFHDPDRQPGSRFTGMQFLFLLVGGIVFGSLAVVAVMIMKG